MRKSALIFGILSISVWWIPLGPVPLLIPLWGIIISQEVYQERANLAFTLSVIGLVLAIVSFMFDAVSIVTYTLF